MWRSGRKGVIAKRRDRGSILVRSGVTTKTGVQGVITVNSFGNFIGTRWFIMLRNTFWRRLLH